MCRDPSRHAAKEGAEASNGGTVEGGKEFLNESRELR